MKIGQRIQGAKRRRSFSELMQVYAENYRLLQLLFDDFDLQGSAFMSEIEGELPLYLEIMDRARFTTMARLTHLIDGVEQPRSSDPDAHLRIYHDAQLAEVTHCYPDSVVQPLFGALVDADRVVDHRWRMNLFLARWLDYLSGLGHGLNTLRSCEAVEPSHWLDKPEGQP